MFQLADRFQFPTYTRASFQAAAGIQAPAWNPAYPIKDWFDPDARDGNAYRVWNGSDTAPALVDLILPKAEAMTVNLPGAPVFAPYVPVPTPATKQTRFAGMFFAPQAVDPLTLSSRADADRLAEIAGATVIDPTASPNQFLAFNWNGETRRPYALVPPGFAGDHTVAGQNVGAILAAMNAQGVASLGHFSASQLALHILTWVPETAPSGLDVTARVPEPIALKSGETLAPMMVGAGVFTAVVLGPAEHAPGVGVAAGSPDGFGASDRVMLTFVHDAIAKATAV